MYKVWVITELFNFVYPLPVWLERYTLYPAIPESVSVQIKETECRTPLEITKVTVVVCTSAPLVAVIVNG